MISIASDDALIDAKMMPPYQLAFPEHGYVEA